jgi:hypothetical protein
MVCGLTAGGRSHERTRLESEFRSSQKSDFQRLLDDSGIVKRGFARKSRPLFAAGRPAYSLLSSCFDRVLRAKVFAPAGLRHFFTVYQEKGPTKLAWLIANAKEFSHRWAALGLLYSYNAVQIGGCTVKSNFLSRSLLGLCMTSAE